jgi:CP family cyanate transporter-like MFS transporter
MNAPWLDQRYAAARPAGDALPVTRAGARARRTPRERLAGAVLGAGLMLIALNLRIGVASVGPVLPDIRAGLGLSAATVSLLTTIPVVAFGAFAFLAPWLTRRVGMNTLLGLAMAALTAGIALRLQPSLAALLTGTVIVGAAIALANVVVPAVIKHHYPRRVGFMTGLYSTALFLGAAVGDGLTVPLLPAVGGHWRSALGLWSVPAAAGFLLWLPQLFRAPGGCPGGTTADSAGGSAGRGGGVPAAHAVRDGSFFRRVLTDPAAVAVTVLMGAQCTGYYATLTWLPTLLRDRGMAPHDAGWMLSYSAFPGIVAALASPGLARRVRPTWAPIALSVLLDAAAYAGLAAAPLAAPYLWMTLLGLGQGAALSLSLCYVAWRSPDSRHTAHVSTMAQGFGYLTASLGPVGIGAVHAATGNWTAPLLVLAALLVPQLIAGALASRERFVLARRTRHADTVPLPALPARA